MSVRSRARRWRAHAPPREQGMKAGRSVLAVEWPTVNAGSCWLLLTYPDCTVADFLHAISEPPDINSIAAG